MTYAGGIIAAIATTWLKKVTLLKRNFNYNQESKIKDRGVMIIREARHTYLLNQRNWPTSQEIINLRFTEDLEAWRYTLVHHHATLFIIIKLYNNRIIYYYSIHVNESAYITKNVQQHLISGSVKFIRYKKHGNKRNNLTTSQLHRIFQISSIRSLLIKTSLLSWLPQTLSAYQEHNTTPILTQTEAKIQMSCNLFKH